MSMPNIPDVNPSITINRTNAIDLLLASIAFEELGLAHMINAEAEKIQYILGTLVDQEGNPIRPPAGIVDEIQDLLDINDSVEQTLRTVVKKEMLLQFKLEDILDLLPGINIFSNTAVVEGFFNEIAVTATDIAYYHTQ